MHHYRNFLYRICIIITLLIISFTNPQAAAENADEFDERYGSASQASSASFTDPSTRTPDSVRIILVPNDPTGAIPEDAQALILAELQTYYNPVVLSLRLPNTAKQALAGIVGVAAAFPSFQVPVPLLLGALGEIGVSVEMLPTYIALIIAPPLPVITGILAAYNGFAKLLSYETPESIENQKNVTTRQSSRFEDRVYSYPSKAFQWAFWGLTMAAIIWNLEKNVKGWGPYYIWAVGFSAVFLLPMYYMYVASTNNPNKHPYRHYDSKESEKRQKAYLEIIKAVEEEVRDGNLEGTRELARQMNILVREAPVTPQPTTPLLTPSHSSVTDDAVRRAPVTTESANDINASTRTGTNENLLQLKPLRHRYAYLNVLNEMDEIYQKIPTWKKMWTKGKGMVALFASDLVQASGVPMRTLLVSGISYNIFQSFLPQTYAIGGSVIVTLGFTPGILSAAYKEIPLTRNEFYEFFGLYAADSPPYWGNKYASFLTDRVPSIIAMSGAMYIVLPMWYYLRHNILEEVFSIHNLPAQLCLITPLLITTFAGARQFVAKRTSMIANWMSTGMEINMCCTFKLLPCCCCRPFTNLSNGQQLLEKLREMELKTANLNERAITALSLELTPSSLSAE